jgi:mannose/fructose/N-acetylgalactosamine-specific phosphotransferase system component IID
MMDNISRAASLLGIIMIGAICAQTMSISLNWVPSLGGVSVNVQTDILDAIMPNLLPVVAIFAVYGLLKKKVSITWIIIGIFVLNIVMGLLGMY